MIPRPDPRRWVLPLLVLGSLLGAATHADAAPKVSAPKAQKKSVKLPLMPGTLVGHINPYVVQRGDTLAWVAARFGVHPSHVVKVSAKELSEGMQHGRTIHVDQRRIQPVFRAGTNGVVLNLPEAEVYLVRDGALVRAYPVAVSNADWKAPIGDTRVVDMMKNPTWYIPKKIQEEMRKNGQEVKEKVDPGPNNPLGVRWIGWADGTYGFHGTTVPTSIKHYASHGCVRFLRDDIIDLYDHVSVGTPVHVYYQPVTLAVDHKTVWISVFPDYYGLGFDFHGAVKALAQEAGVLDRVSWPLVEAAFREKDGTIMPISKPLPGAKPTPKPHPTPKPTPKATPKPSPTPFATPLPASVAPSLLPLASPTPTTPLVSPTPTAPPVTPTAIPATAAPATATPYPLTPTSLRTPNP